MAERALTEEAMLEGLNDIRLPGDAPGGLAADLVAAAGLGILLALAAAALLSFVTKRRPARVPMTERHEPETGAGDEAARRRALLRRLKRENPGRYSEFARDLYRPGGLPDTAALRTILEAR